MKHLATRTIAAVATAGILALGLAACGSADDKGGSNPPAAADNQNEAPPTPGTLVCDDLEKATDKTGIKEGLTFDDLPVEKMNELYAWMKEHGKEFKDVELGKNVTAVGKYGPEYDASEHPPADVFDGYIDASTAVDKTCPDIGFGFEN